MLVGASVLVLAIALFFESGLRNALQSAVPAGVLLALAGHLFTQAKAISDSEEKTSAFNLDGYRQASEHAHSLLSDGNNDRVKWIEAARCLAHAEQLARGVTVAEHILLLEVERLKFRGRFYSLIAGKEPQFFYGVPSIYPTLDEAAMASTAGDERNGRVTTSTVHELDEASIRAVWLAAGWPKDYRDPVGNRFTPDESAKLRLHLPQLHAFLEHRRTWASASGKLFRRNLDEG